MTSTLPLLLGFLVMTAAVVPLLTRALGRDAGWLVGAGFAGTLGLAIAVAGPALDGGAATWTATYVPDLLGPGADAQVALRLDGLALLFTVLVLGVGALVLVYTARYTARGTRNTRMMVLLTAFAAAMMTLVLADDIALLYVGWELTSIISFLLIGGDGTAGATPARRAFVVTAVGGLCMLAGLVLLANVAGTTSLSAILTSPEVAASPALGAAGVLILVAIGTKSALIPFGFWLRGAMVAPTPISTYLHAATMVKAGIYLLARTTPITLEIGWWLPVVVTLGLATTVLGGIQALRATDLKALLAGSTVSQLGFIAATLAVGTDAALVAGLVHTLAHAAFKGALFMITGIVDHETGTRDLRELGGLRRTMPLTAAVATLAGLSMAGVPPLLGFVSKEAVLASFLETSPLLLVLIAAAAVLTAAYSLRFVIGTFFGSRPGIGHEPPRSFLVGPAVIAGVGLVAGLWLAPVDRLIAAAATAAGPGTDLLEPHLALWHGVNAPLLASIAALLGGALAWWTLGRHERTFPTGPLEGPRLFDRGNDAVLALGAAAGRPFLALRPASQLSWLLATSITVLVAVGAMTELAPVDVPAGSLAEWGVVAVVAAALVTLLRVPSRLGVATLIGSVGFLITGVYVLRRAPDLALTQLLVESLTVVLIVLVFRWGPREFEPHRERRRRTVTAVTAVVAGVGASVATALLLPSRPPSELNRYYMDAAGPETGGANVVNTILVDFRGLDTLGEITVLLVAGVGVYVVTRGRRSSR